MGATRENEKVYFDKAKLQSVARCKGMNLEELSAKCGMGASYFSARASDGWIPLYIAESLKRECGILRKSYEIKQGHMESLAANPKARESIEVDKHRLYAEIQLRGMQIREASLGMGYKEDTLAAAASRGKISPLMARQLETIYGIAPADYERIEKNEQYLDDSCTLDDSAKEACASDEDAVYRATYSAIMNTWAFIREDLKTIIKEALSE